MSRSLALCCLILSIGSNAQGVRYLSICSINKVYSANGAYFLKSIPFTYFAPETTGKTIVYSKDSVPIYQLDRYFEINKKSRKLFLSNDGQALIYVCSTEFIFLGKIYPGISIYKKGRLSDSHLYAEFVSRDPKISFEHYYFYKHPADSLVRYNDKELVVYGHPANELETFLYANGSAYCKDDSVHVFCRPDAVISIDMKSCQLLVRALSHFTMNQVRSFSPGRFIQYYFDCPRCNPGPRLKTGESFDQGLAKYLNMKLYPVEDQRQQAFKEHVLYVNTILDRSGKLSSIDPNEISVANEFHPHKNDTHDAKLEKFFQETSFDTSFLPEGVEQWPCYGSVSLRNRNKRIAREERNQEIIEERNEVERRQQLDSINGVYIPRNLEDCFLDLVKALSSKEIDEMRHLKSRKEMGKYHFSLGIWIRNNWGLWGGSRLQLYMRKRDVNHPDYMSSIVLEFFTTG